MHKSGRPTLVGTTSVERSEALAKLLDEDGASRPACLPLPSVLSGLKALVHIMNLQAALQDGYVRVYVWLCS